jgi:hypothetical protein
VRNTIESRRGLGKNGTMFIEVNQLGNDEGVKKRDKRGFATSICMSGGYNAPRQ